MKKNITFFFILFSSFLLFAGTDGFDSYTNGNYEEAWNYYMERFEADDADPLAAYNLAVISERFNKPGFAVYFYIQTLQRSPEFSEAKNNLSLLSREINVSIPEVLMVPDDSLDITLIIFFVALYVFAALFSMLCFKPDWRIKTALLPVFLILIVAGVLYFSKYMESLEESWAVLVEDSALHSGPDASLKEVGTIKEGEILIVETVSDEWCKIKGFNDNVEGWLEMSNIRRIIRGRK